MKRREIRLETLLGRLLVDSQGDKVGHIEEIVATQSGADWVIETVLVGPSGLADRFFAGGVPPLFSRFLGSRDEPYEIPWNELDLTDIEHPCLMCTKEDLARPAVGAGFGEGPPWLGAG